MNTHVHSDCLTLNHALIMALVMTINIKMVDMQILQLVIWAQILIFRFKVNLKNFNMHSKLNKKFQKLTTSKLFHRISKTSNW